MIEARGYGSCLIGAREISDLIGAFGFELGRSGRCLWIGAREISIRSDLVGSDRCLWIGAREIGIEMIQKIDSEREIGIEMIGARELWISIDQEGELI